MTINLTSDHEQLIAEAIKAGTYENSDQMIQRALEVLRAEDRWLEENRTTIDAKIDHALAQFQRGECFSAEESRKDMESRKAAWLSKRAG
ncbi:MAG TPA: hypothetical protein VGM43_07120 [Bryobacteraceae bacterium]